MWFVARKSRGALAYNDAVRNRRDLQCGATRYRRLRHEAVDRDACLSGRSQELLDGNRIYRGSWTGVGSTARARL